MSIRKPYVGAMGIKGLRKIAQRVARNASKTCTNPLNTLIDSQLVELYLRFEKGQEVDRVRKVIQLDWKLLKNVGICTLRRNLKNFREDALTLKQKAIVAATPVQKEKIEKDVKRIVEELDGLGSLRWLIEQQMERMSMCREREKMTKLPFTLTNTVVRDLGDLLEKYLKLEIDLGLIDSKGSKVDLLIKEKFINILDNTLQNSGKNLLGATNEFLIEAEKEAITFDEDADGVYKQSIPVSNNK